MFVFCCYYPNSKTKVLFSAKLRYFQHKSKVFVLKKTNDATTARPHKVFLAFQLLAIASPISLDLSAILQPNKLCSMIFLRSTITFSSTQEPSDTKHTHFAILLTLCNLPNARESKINEQARRSCQISEISKKIVYF